MEKKQRPFSYKISTASGLGIPTGKSLLYYANLLPMVKYWIRVNEGGYWV